ncbi:3'-5' exonuclease [Salix suchowensis]|nr:3'-5' exonuclease [Salix suchowensis]
MAPQSLRGQTHRPPGSRNAGARVHDARRAHSSVSCAVDLGLSKLTIAMSVTGYRRARRDGHLPSPPAEVGKFLHAPVAPKKRSNKRKRRLRTLDWIPGPVNWYYEDDIGQLGLDASDGILVPGFPYRSVCQHPSIRPSVVLCHLRWTFLLSCAVLRFCFLSHTYTSTLPPRTLVTLHMSSSTFFLCPVQFRLQAPLIARYRNIEDRGNFARHLVSYFSFTANLLAYLATMASFTKEDERIIVQLCKRDSTTHKRRSGVFTDELKLKTYQLKYGVSNRLANRIALQPTLFEAAQRANGIRVPELLYHFKEGGSRTSSWSTSSSGERGSATTKKPYHGSRSRREAHARTGRRRQRPLWRGHARQYGHHGLQEHVVPARFVREIHTRYHPQTISHRPSRQVSWSGASNMKTMVEVYANLAMTGEPSLGESLLCSVIPRMELTLLYQVLTTTASPRRGEEDMPRLRPAKRKDREAEQLEPKSLKRKRRKTDDGGYRALSAAPEAGPSRITLDSTPTPPDPIDLDGQPRLFLQTLLRRALQRSQGI